MLEFFFRKYCKRVFLIVAVVLVRLEIIFKRCVGVNVYVKAEVIGTISQTIKPGRLAAEALS